MIERATENATINFRDGNGTNMKNIDDDSKTLFSKVKSEKKHQKQLFERPFKSMPFLGRGVHFVDDESFLHSPEVTRVSRQCSSLAGVFIENQFTPLVPSLSEHVQNHYLQMKQKVNLSYHPLSVTLYLSLGRDQQRLL